jgi:hypothetical protein
MFDQCLVADLLDDPSACVNDRLHEIGKGAGRHHQVSVVSRNLRSRKCGEALRQSKALGVAFAVRGPARVGIGEPPVDGCPANGTPLFGILLHR